LLFALALALALALSLLLLSFFFLLFLLALPYCSPLFFFLTKMPPRKQTPLVTREGPAADTQAPASPATVELTTGLGKRPRDDELHQLELERARIELERQRKALAFEEDLHRRQLAQYDAGVPDPNRRQNNVDDEEEGEIPPEAKEAALLFPAISQKDIAAIFENKFDPRNLYKLYRKVSLTVVEEEEISVSGGKIRTKKRTGTTKDYPNPDTWSAGFLQYIAVLSRFDKYHGLTYPLINFHARIMDLAKAYLWESVLTLALTFHQERVVMGMTDDKAWQMSPVLVDEHLRNSLRSRPFNPSQSTPQHSGFNNNRSYENNNNMPTEFCFRWNSGDCSAPNCRRIHACRRCKKNHKEKDHKG
jgi:hypothetical protein